MPRPADGQERCAATDEGSVSEILLKRTRCLPSRLNPGSGTEKDELDETTREGAEVQYEAKPKAAYQSHIAVCD